MVMEASWMVLVSLQEKTLLFLSLSLPHENTKKR